MGGKAEDLTGRVFGGLVVLHKGLDRGKRVMWMCRCECGVTKPIRTDHLNSGATKSCGCLLVSNMTTHGMSNTPEYSIWEAIVQRTTNPNCQEFKRYGGRGIVMCLKWRKSFLSFLTDMGKHPSSKHSIDRINNSKGYYKRNCA